MVGVGILSPPVNVVQYHLSSTIAILLVEIPLNPFHEMILENAFDELVQNVGSEHHINVGAVEIIRERLSNSRVKTSDMYAWGMTYYKITNNSIFIP